MHLGAQAGGGMGVMLVLSVLHALRPAQPMRSSPRMGALAESPAIIELSKLKEQAGPSLAKLRANNGWCIDDDQLCDLRRKKETILAEASYLPPHEQAHLVLSVELAHQAMTAADKVDTLRHIFATARVLVSLRAEARIVEAALLAGVCETGVTPGDIGSVLGCDAASPDSNSSLTVGQGVSKVWKLSSLLERSSELEELGTEADGLATELAVATTEAKEEVARAVERAGVDREVAKAEQLERQCQILLAGCDVSDSMFVSLASRLVSMRELQAAVAGKPLQDDDLSAAPRLSACALGCMSECALDQSAACAAFQRMGGERDTWQQLIARKDAFTRQTRDVFLPLADRLGMWYFKTELETLSLAVASPREFLELSTVLEQVRCDAQPSLAEAQAKLETALAADPVLSKHARQISVRSRVKGTQT